MNDDKIDPKLRATLSKIPANTVKIEDPRYEIFYPNISGYCDGIGYYRCYMYNGASIDTFNDEKNPVRYEIIYHDDTHKRIECMRLTLLYPRAKLGGIFTSLPYGIVKKSVPGIGATTLALNQPRDTIIVLPTKKLAYQKYLRGYNKERTSNRFLYVGSDIPEEKCKSPTDEQIRSYIAEKRTGTFPYKKILVVADSLGRVMEQIKYIKEEPTRFVRKKLEEYAEKLKHDPSLPPLNIPITKLYEPHMDWHIMVDEIDTFQSDGKFREAMENVIDYYLEFPPIKRCLVSATIRPFTHPQLKEEPLLEINYEHPKKRPVNIIRTNNMHREVADRLGFCRKQYPNDKIVVAYNSIRSINTVIRLLPVELRADCSVACSSQSQTMVGEYYRSLHSGKLATPITFITSTYFVGVDIEERFHLLTVTDPRRIQTLLSPEKIYQISGRCRDELGLLSETIIYDFYKPKTPEKAITLEEYEHKAEILSQFANSSEDIQKSCENVLPANFADVKDAIVERSKHSVFGSQPISIIRRNIHGKVVPAYLNIDALGEYQQLCTETYTTKERFFATLRETCQICNTAYHSHKKNAEQIQIEETDRENRKNVIIQYVQASIDELLQAKSQGPITDDVLDRMIRKPRDNRHGRTFLKRVKELYPYVPLDKLIDILTPRLTKGGINWNAVWYRNLRRSIFFACLADDHPFRILLRDYFPQESRMTSDEIREKMNAVLINIQARELKSNREAIKLYHCFFEEKRSHNKTNFRTVGAVRDMGFEPLQRIAATTTVNRILELM
ncbi:hypothetical protein [Alistipes sp.]|uniref:hypothetical protein n=3 Tax=Alistipes TaxID=239759 RepID=UPI0025BD69F8|nr:hypothetical protein [Alistipes sp.]MCI7139701.1 hypothetical protein [Alistipes sp.]